MQQNKNLHFMCKKKKIIGNKHEIFGIAMRNLTKLLGHVMKNNGKGPSTIRQIAYVFIWN